MRDVALESVAELLTFAGEIVATVLLTVVGLAAEVAGVSRLAVGVDGLTLWFLFMGGLALSAGAYELGYRTLLPKLTA